MTIGAAVGFVALGLAFGAAAVRTREAFWAIGSAAILAFLGYRIAQVGIDPTRFVGSTDGMLTVAGTLLMAAAITVLMGLPKAADVGLIYGSALPERAFDHALLDARRPFAEAVTADDESMEVKARWGASLTARPPNDAWASLAAQIARIDEDFVAGVKAGRSRDEWLPWQANVDQVHAEWAALRSAYQAEGATRARRLARLTWTALVASLALAVAGGFNLTNGLFSNPPQGRAAFVPSAPVGRSLHLAPLGDVSAGQLQRLADFYAERFNLRVNVLPPSPIPDAARDPARGQLVAEAIIDGLRDAYPEARDPARVVIGVTREDLYMRARPDWSWAFGRTDVQVAVLSTSMMGPEPGPFGHRLEDARLRKMVTKYIGILYFGLPASNDPRSVLYGNIQGVSDLDGMGEDF